MKAAALLDVLAALDCEAKLVDGEIAIAGHSPPPEPLLALVRTHKRALVDHLRPPSMWNKADWLAYFHERAGILEYDAGLPRQHAEEEALQECFHRMTGRRL